MRSDGVGKGVCGMAVGRVSGAERARGDGEETLGVQGDVGEHEEGVSM